MLAGLGSGCHRPPPASQFPSARLAIERMREVQSCSRGLSGEGVLDYLGDDGRVRARALYVVSRPDRLRLDVLSPLGGVLSTLTSDGDRFAFLDARNRQFLHGPATECNVERALQVPVPPAALGELLSGQAPILVHEPGQASLEWERGAYSLVVESLHGARERVRLVPRESDYALPFGQQRLRVLEVEVSQRGLVLYSVELGEHRAARRAEPRVDPDGVLPDVPPSGPACGAEVPRHLRFVVPGAGKDIVLSQQDVHHNPPLTLGLFTQRAPAGVSVIRSRCAAP